METFIPRGKIFGPILPQFVLEKPITFGAKIMYALLCNYAFEKDHCWPSHATLAERLSCSISSVKKYLAELAGEKLIDIRREQYRSCVYYLLCPAALSSESPKPDHTQTKSGREQPKSDGIQPEIGYINNLKKQEENTNPPLPPVPKVIPAVSSGPGFAGGGGPLFQDFEKAWDAYPKKEALGIARLAWSNLRRNNHLPPLDMILASIRRFMGTESWQREGGRYVPQMGNWLRGQRWLDPLSPEEEQKTQVQEAVQVIAQQQEALEAERKAESEHLTPLFEAFAEKFRTSWNPNIESMAFGAWRYLRSKGQAPLSSDVPDGNTLDIMAFMKAFQRKCEETACHAEHLARNPQAPANNFRREPRNCHAGIPANLGSVLRTCGLSAWPVPQKEALCAAV